MFKGFYNLTSGMVTQQQNLNVVGNNMVNISTAGFKESRYAATTFDDVMYARVGNKEKIYTDIGRQSYIRANSEIKVLFDQGIPEPTGIPLDFAIMGEGFFAVQTEDGVAYTRAGNFSLDDEGYLCVPGAGRVLAPRAPPSQPHTAPLSAAAPGPPPPAGGAFLGQLGVYTFPDMEQVEYDGRGMFTGEGAQAAAAPTIYWKYLERSNVDMIRQMTEMLTCQRSLQSAAQVTKMYDELMSHVSSDIGRM